MACALTSVRSNSIRRPPTTASAESAARLIIDTVSDFELEERLIRLEEKMENLLGGNHHGAN